MGIDREAQRVLVSWVRVRVRVHTCRTRSLCLTHALPWPRARTRGAHYIRGQRRAGIGPADTLGGGRLFKQDKRPATLSNAKFRLHEAWPHELKQIISTRGRSLLLRFVRLCFPGISSGGRGFVRGTGTVSRV